MSRESDPSESTSRTTGCRKRVSVIIPCLEEQEAIGPLVTAIREQGIGQVIVVDGGSRDQTVAHARAAGALVVVEPRRGYGRALLTGLTHLAPEAEVVLFIDGDGSDRPDKIPDVLAPLENGTADFVLGSRRLGEREQGSLAPTQIAAGYLAGLLVRLVYGAKFTDMSPFRAVKRATLDALGMRETGFGWNLEMQMRIAASGYAIAEVPVGQRRRVGGVSKVSGNWRAVVPVAWSLTATFVRLAFALRRGVVKQAQPGRG